MPIIPDRLFLEALGLVCLSLLISSFAGGWPGLLLGLITLAISFPLSTLIIKPNTTKRTYLSALYLITARLAWIAFSCLSLAGSTLLSLASDTPLLTPLYWAVMIITAMIFLKKKDHILISLGTSIGYITLSISAYIGLTYTFDTLITGPVAFEQGFLFIGFTLTYLTFALPSLPAKLQIPSLIAGCIGLYITGYVTQFSPSIVNSLLGISLAYGWALLCWRNQRFGKRFTHHPSLHISTQDMDDAALIAKTYVMRHPLNGVTLEDIALHITPSTRWPDPPEWKFDAWMVHTGKGTSPYDLYVQTLLDFLKHHYPGSPKQPQLFPLTIPQSGHDKLLLEEDVKNRNLDIPSFHQ